ncbi:MAG: hypothetical protein JWO78_1584 [Micavibrio sp.]|nr:hypothetical protein [Micavibrio sp.]
MNSTISIVFCVIAGTVLGDAVKEYDAEQFQKNTPSFAYKTDAMDFRTRDSKPVRLNAELVLSSQNPKCLEEIKNRTYWSINDQVRNATYQDILRQAVPTSDLLPIEEMNYKMSNRKKDSLGPGVCAIKKISSLTYAPG